MARFDVNTGDPIKVVGDHLRNGGKTGIVVLLNTTDVCVRFPDGDEYWYAWRNLEPATEADAPTVADLLARITENVNKVNADLVEVRKLLGLG